MKKFLSGLMLSFFIFSSFFVLAHDLFINEVEYNPSGAENESEWLELFNNGTESIDLS